MDATQTLFLQKNQDSHEREHQILFRAEGPLSSDPERANLEAGRGMASPAGKPSPKTRRMYEFDYPPHLLKSIHIILKKRGGLSTFS